ncbi:helix-turn-helix transcriptional regulator [Riemerella anatipestifer]|uniref:helix-turn-helix transcriptional regulator n=1 Tax=Riemerella anatipestifer TaxID=34085 RepID=UPI0012AD20E9|nr:helix-turn-helix transcriptional regulator [Riemerella anatipestifer]MCQ4156148.1 helix-turn-helix transcriptional regulator [Riemerella anatipestifer]MDR7776239.1 helix-turn-helix transcriptional regulator [Riemerella anatipestifer]MDR7784881.1 helix-turn-helix transcriptional regulator [Riemerella anatipestifer]MDY3347906.1 helix-turn-helix transcriptional regulator [Riemerella anatipestifer]MDY3350235.1 helix-turn-helix transcriptional regulator [Riemerella anatipestifer]
MGATERVVQFIEYKGISKYKFCKDLGFSNKFLDNSSNMGTDKACKILHYFPEINPEWLLTGKGEMIKSKQGGEVEKSKNLIPFYDDVATVGGTDLVADTYNAVSVATDYIDAGDWFPSATAAIRHYGTSMVEYPNGCILALKRIYDTNSIVWGRNYVIETDEIRVTKRMQTCKTDDECIMAYSTNTETYPDGQLVHEPFKIRKENIRRIFLVLGRVVKEYSSDPVFVG